MLPVVAGKSLEGVRNPTPLPDPSFSTNNISLQKSNLAMTDEPQN